VTSEGWLRRLRTVEIEHAAAFCPAGARILEIGAGAGFQALRLQQLGFDIDAIDISVGDQQVFPVRKYDGIQIPWPPSSFDVVFTSNVLEHINGLPQMQREITRVLRPGGVAVHVVPTHSWRAWTTATSAPAGLLALARRANWRRVIGPLLPLRHGVRGNILSETWLFHPRHWRRTFTADGFVVLRAEPMGLFYTGNELLGPRLSVPLRQVLARLLGSACWIFEVAPRQSELP